MRKYVKGILQTFRAIISTTYEFDIGLDRHKNDIFRGEERSHS